MEIKLGTHAQYIVSMMTTLYEYPQEFFFKITSLLKLANGSTHGDELGTHAYFMTIKHSGIFL